jgi:hypothetical protein
MNPPPRPQHLSRDNLILTMAANISGVEASEAGEDETYIITESYEDEEGLTLEVAVAAGSASGAEDTFTCGGCQASFHDLQHFLVHKSECRSRSGTALTVDAEEENIIVFEEEEDGGDAQKEEEAGAGAVEAIVVPVTQENGTSEIVLAVADEGRDYEALQEDDEGEEIVVPQEFLDIATGTISYVWSSRSER